MFGAIKLKNMNKNLNQKCWLVELNQFYCEKNGWKKWLKQRSGHEEFGEEYM